MCVCGGGGGGEEEWVCTGNAVACVGMEEWPGESGVRTRPPQLAYHVAAHPTCPRSMVSGTPTPSARCVLCGGRHRTGPPRTPRPHNPTQLPSPSHPFHPLHTSIGLPSTSLLPHSQHVRPRCCAAFLLLVLLQVLLFPAMKPDNNDRSTAAATAAAAAAADAVAGLSLVSGWEGICNCYAVCCCTLHLPACRTLLPCFGWGRGAGLRPRRLSSITRRRRGSLGHNAY